MLVFSGGAATRPPAGRSRPPSPPPVCVLVVGRLVSCDYSAMFNTAVQQCTTAARGYWILLPYRGVNNMSSYKKINVVTELQIIRSYSYFVWSGAPCKSPLFSAEGMRLCGLVQQHYASYHTSSVGNQKRARSTYKTYSSKYHTEYIRKVLHHFRPRRPRAPCPGSDQCQPQTTIYRGQRVRALCVYHNSYTSY